MFSKALQLLWLRRLSRMGPLGFALAAYGVWQRLSPEDKQRVRSRLGRVTRRADVAIRRGHKSRALKRIASSKHG
jgi:hypothetical protein